MENNQKLQESVFFVEANSFERHMLWKQNKEYNSVTWEQDPSGFLLCVGHIDGNSKYAVWVDFSFAILNGKRVCFYYASSKYVDHDLVNKFFLENYPVKYDNGTRSAMTDANNFHNCTSSLK